MTLSTCQLFADNVYDLLKCCFHFIVRRRMRYCCRISVCPSVKCTLCDTRSSSGDEIANVNCFTTTSYTYSKYNRLAHRPQCFTTDRKQQVTITTVKRNLNDKLQVSNCEIHFTRECVNAH